MPEKTQGFIRRGSAQTAQSSRRPLIIELVPSSCWFSNVRSEVPPAVWEKLKKHTAHLASNRCEICAGRGPKWPVECHEIWAYNDDLLVQKLAGLTALCPSCHEVKHIGLASKRGRLDQALKHLAKVNGWSLDDSKVYVEVSFEEWSRRSQKEWSLDLTFLVDILKNLGVEYASPPPKHSR